MEDKSKEQKRKVCENMVPEVEVQPGNTRTYARSLHVFIYIRVGHSER